MIDTIDCVKCGGEGHYCWYGPFDVGAVECEDCDNSGSTKDSWFESVSAWNTEQAQKGATDA